MQDHTYVQLAMVMVMMLTAIGIVNIRCKYSKPGLRT